MSNTTGRPLLRYLMAALLLAGASAVAADSDQQAASEATAAPPTGEGAAASEQAAAAQEQADNVVDEKRKTIVKEAVQALRETYTALGALDQGNSDEALAALERAAGKLEIVMAREPELALAPTDVSARMVDLVSTPKEIRDVRKRLARHLDDGEVQQARNLLTPLASEIVVSTVSLPLATYPDAIRDAAALIDDGHTEQAADVLRTALGTLVITDRVIPLPIVVADSLLAEAEKLAGKQDRSDDESKTLARLLGQAREQLDKAEALGYMKRRDASRLRDEVGRIERAVRKQGVADEGVFSRLRDALGEMRDAVID